MKTILMPVLALLLLPACLGPAEVVNVSCGPGSGGSIGTSTGSTGATCGAPGAACAFNGQCCPGLTCQAGSCVAFSDVATSTTGSCLGGCTTSAGVGSTMGSTGTTSSGACACATSADCPSSYDCVNAQCERVFTTSGSNGGTGGVDVACSLRGGTQGTTGSGACGCVADADCNDAYHQGFICAGNICRIGPNAGAVSSTGGACAQQGNSGSSTTGGSTPLVLSFDGAPVRFTQAKGSFELSGQGASVATDWVSSATPWLALDRNGNGTIDDGRELFGSMTDLGGRTAHDGFEALAALDANHDGRIDARDPAFGKLVLWSDANQDRVSQPGELMTLAQAGVVAIELSIAVTPRCDARGNCAREHAAFLFEGHGGRVQRGQVVDVWLRNRPATLATK